MKNTTPVDLIIVIISRREIKECNTERILALFHTIIFERNLINKVELCVEGYDSDERELCTIKEVRQFMLEIKSTAFFYILSFQTESLNFVMFSTCEYKTENGKIYIEQETVVEFMLQQFSEINLLEHAGVITHADNRRITDMAGSYFAR